MRRAVWLMIACRGLMAAADLKMPLFFEPDSEGGITVLINLTK